MLELHRACYVGAYSTPPGPTLTKVRPPASSATGPEADPRSRDTHGSEHWRLRSSRPGRYATQGQRRGRRRFRGCLGSPEDLSEVNHQPSEVGRVGWSPAPHGHPVCRRMPSEDRSELITLFFDLKDEAQVKMHPSPPAPMMPVASFASQFPGCVDHKSSLGRLSSRSLPVQGSVLHHGQRTRRSLLRAAR